MLSEFTLRGRLYPIYKSPSDLKKDFKEKYLSESPFKIDAVIRLRKHQVHKVLRNNPEILDGRYEFQKKDNEGILVHKESGLRIKFPIDDYIPRGLLERGLDGPYFFMYDRVGGGRGITLLLLYHVSTKIV